MCWAGFAVCRHLLGLRISGPMNVAAWIIQPPPPPPHETGAKGVEEEQPVTVHGALAGINLGFLSWGEAGRFFISLGGGFIGLG